MSNSPKYTTSSPISSPPKSGLPVFFCSDSMVARRRICKASILPAVRVASSFLPSRLRARLARVWRFSAGAPPSKTKTGFIPKKRSLQIRRKKPTTWEFRNARPSLSRTALRNCDKMHQWGGLRHKVLDKSILMRPLLDVFWPRSRV